MKNFKFFVENSMHYDLPRKRLCPPGYITYYHGSTKFKYEQIVREGKIKSWGEEGIDKSSSGDLTEKGLIWFFRDINLAYLYSKGSEEIRKREVSTGGIIEVDLPKRLKLVDRYHKISKEEAEKLIPLYPEFAQSYKPIKEGLGLSYAVTRIWEYRSEKNKIHWGDILKLLNYDGIIYDEDQYGIAAKELPIAAAWRLT